MSGPEKAFQDAGQIFNNGVRYGFEDAQLSSFGYHLLRLTAIGVAGDEVADLLELARAAFQETDVSAHVARIKQRNDHSALALAIADIVEAAEGRNLRDVMFGAVLGAYTAVGSRVDDQTLISIIGAIGGAIAMSVDKFVDSASRNRSLSEYLSGEGVI